MTAGIEIINTAGTTLIDENYTNLAVRQKGSVKLGSNNRLNIPLTNGADSPLVAVRSTNPAMSPLVNTTATTPFIQLRGRDGDTAIDVDYYMFDKPLASLASGNAGLQVFSPSGVLTFDSRLQYARVVDIFGGDTQGAWAGTRTYPAGRKYAVAQLKTAWRKSTTNAGGGFYNLTYRSSMARVVDNQVITSFQIDTIKIEFDRPLNIDNMAATFAVLDVTGY